MYHLFTSHQVQWPLIQLDVVKLTSNPASRMCVAATNTTSLYHSCDLLPIDHSSQRHFLILRVFFRLPALLHQMPIVIKSDEWDLLLSSWCPFHLTCLLTATTTRVVCWQDHTPVTSLPCYLQGKLQRRYKPSWYKHVPLYNVMYFIFLPMLFLLY